MPSTAININDIFFGSEQSKYAGIALFSTITILCIAILFSSSKIPIDQRIGFVISILIISIPSILMSLFELTCIVTGGNSESRWWCWALAWVLSIIIIVNCITIIISLIMSMSSYDIANERIENDIENCKVNKDNANKYAKNIMIKYEKDIKPQNSQQMQKNANSEKQQQKQYEEQKQQNEMQKQQKLQIQQMQEQEKEQTQHNTEKQNKMQQQEQRRYHQQQQKQHQEHQQMQQKPIQQMQQQIPQQLAQPVHHMEVQPRPQMNNALSGFDYNDTLSSISEVADVSHSQAPNKKMSYEEKFYMQGYDNSSDKFQSY